MQPTDPSSTTLSLVPGPEAEGSEGTRTRVDAWGLSDVGKVRSRNEDHFLIVRAGRFLESVQTNLGWEMVPAWSEESGYGFVVADGMGGHAGGEVASELAITTLVNLVLTTPDWMFHWEDRRALDAAVGRMRKRFSRVNRAITDQAEADPGLRGLGTTLTVAASLGRTLFVAHIGDSRAYLFRAGNLRRLTRDHTIAQSLVDVGAISAEEAVVHRMRHVLTRALGAPRGWTPTCIGSNCATATACCSARTA